MAVLPKSRNQTITFSRSITCTHREENIQLCTFSYNLSFPLLLEVGRATKWVPCFHLNQDKILNKQAAFYMIRCSIPHVVLVFYFTDLVDSVKNEITEELKFLLSAYNKTSLIILIGDNETNSDGESCGLETNGLSS